LAQIRKIALQVLGILALYACKPTPETLTEQPRQPEVMTKQAISEAIDASLRQEAPYRWEDATSDFLWNVTIHKDSIITVGYQPEGFTNIDERLHEIDGQSIAWRRALDRVKISVQKVYDDLGAGLDVEDRVLNVHETLTFI